MYVVREFKNDTQTHNTQDKIGTRVEVNKIKPYSLKKKIKAYSLKKDISCMYSILASQCQDHHSYCHLDKSEIR